MLESLDAAAVRRWCTVGLSSLRAHQREIDELNVYPVPDGDTGTNLVLTVTAARQALATEPDGDEPVEPGELTRLGRALRCMARGALLGARGNSGVILAQLLQGLADALAVTPQARGRVVAGALTEAAASAYRVVAEPAEGTLLTVARAAAQAAARADSDDLGAVVAAAAEGAAKALALTPTQLPALARAGVVDAGGRGLVVLLEALVEVVTGVAAPTAPPVPVTTGPALLTVARETGSTGYGYEVQYLLDAPAGALPALRAALGPLGDSLIVVDTGLSTADLRTWNVHVHVNDVGAAIEAGIEVGRPHRISVTRFADQPAATAATDASAGSADRSGVLSAVGSLSGGADPRDDGPAYRDALLDADPAGDLPAGPQVRTVLAVGDGVGLRALFIAGGARVLAGRPATADILAGIRAGGGGPVVVLPNDSNSHAVASVAAGQARADGYLVAVVPTRSPVQGLAALAVRDVSRRFEDDVIAMAEAAGACRYAEVVIAARDSDTEAGPCRTGDLLGFVDGTVRLVGADPGDCAGNLLDLLLAGGGELVTVLVGAGAPTGLADAVRAHLAGRWPAVEAQVHDGGQPHHLLMLGVE